MENPHGDNWALDLNNYDWEVRGDKALMTYQDTFNFSIPAVSLEPFIQDLSLDYSAMPLSGVPEIDAIIEGDFEFLGKGFDGIAFRVGDSTVKASTTVPFHPESQAHRTPRRAINHSLQEAELFQELSEAVSCFPEIEVYEHADRLWMVKPYLDLIEPEDMTPEQVWELEECMQALHEAGYALCDTLQVGVRDGRIMFLDVGQACPVDEDTQRQDLLEMRHFANRAGVELKSEDLLRAEVVKLHKYIQFLLRAKAKPEKIEAQGEILRKKFYSLSKQAEKGLEHIEDFIWEEL